jgi:hypothetical protein
MSPNPVAARSEGKKRDIGRNSRDRKEKNVFKLRRIVRMRRPILSIANPKKIV